jgi:hypothetical protein
MKRHAMKTDGGVEILLHAFLTLAPDGDVSHINIPVALSRGKSLLEMGLGRSHGRSGRYDKNDMSALGGNQTPNSRSSSPWPSHYTDFS